jgi:hypothetical protein
MKRLVIGKLAACFVVMGSLGMGCSSSSDSQPVMAAPSGTLDAAFGSGGKAVLPQGVNPVMAVDASGAAYLAGTTIMKLDPSGQRVVSYAAGLSFSLFARALVLDPAGNLYIASSAGGQGQPFQITKLDPNGNRVATFGNAGTALAGPFPFCCDDFANDLVLDANGGLWAVGTMRTRTTDVPSFDAIVIARLDAEGRGIPGFGLDGRQVFMLPGIPSVDAQAAALDAQGNLVVLGLTAVGADRQSVIIKVSPDGALLSGFGTQGVVRLEGCSVQIGLTDILVDAAGDIYVSTDCAAAGPTPRPVATVFKRDRNGAPVGSFGSAGRRDNVFAAGASDSSMATSLALGPSNGVYVGGARGATAAVCGDFAVARLDAGGTAVASFGQAGVAVLDMGAGDGIRSLASRGTGLYAAGISLDPCPVFVGSGGVSSVVRFTP